MPIVRSKEVPVAIPRSIIDDPRLSLEELGLMIRIFSSSSKSVTVPDEHMHIAKSLEKMGFLKSGGE